MAWVPSSEEPEPPEHWVICDGQQIKHEGPFDGKYSPDLRDKFLIGRDFDQVQVDDEEEDLNDQDQNEPIQLEKYRGINPPSVEPYNLNTHTYGVVYIMRVK